MSDPDRLAQLIRIVDGANSLGAGALAEKLVEHGVRVAVPPPSGETPGPDLPRDLVQRREKLGEMLRDLEVIVSNYHSDGWRTRNESDANLFAEWQRVRGALFDALTDMTAEIAALRGEPSPDPVREAAQRVVWAIEREGRGFPDGFAALRDALGKPHPQPERRTQ